MVMVTPLDAALGAEIRGIDLGEAIGDSLMRVLTGALIRTSRHCHQEADAR